MGSSSGENEMGISGAMVDRFSSLTDAVAHRILSFINVDEFGSVMLVSKRLNQLCFSAPCLSMANKSSTDDSSHRAKLDRFFTAYFSRRRQYGAKVEQLSILWSFNQANPLAVEYGMREQNDCDEDDPVFTCLCRCATYCELEHVHLNLVLRAGACLKGEKISACSLATFARNLVLSMNNTGFQLRPRPEYSYSLPSRLESLTLNDIRISCESGFNFGIDQFPKLKRLHLHNISGMEDLQIWNNSLERVEIIVNGSDLHFLTLGSSELRTLQLTWYPRSLIGRVHLYLPKLEHLVWQGLPLMYSVSTINKHMKSAYIYCIWPFRKGLVREDVYNSFVVQCVMSAKSLRLLAKTAQLFYIQCCKTNGVPSLGVETLRIDDFYLTDFEVTGLTFVLKMMPNLKNIYLSSDKDFPFKGKASTHQEGSMYTLDYWEEQNLKFVQQLETATVEIHKEKGNAAELVKYFAKHGGHLENLKVICPPAMVSAVSSQIEVVKNTAVNVTYVQRCDALRRVGNGDEELETMLDQIRGAIAGTN